MSILVLWSSWMGRERELAALLCLSSWCLVIVVWLFLSVPWVCLQFVIVILTYYFWVSFMRIAIAFGESAHLLGLVWAFVTFQNSHVVTQMAIECHFVRAAKDLAHLHRLTLAFVTVQNLLCCLKWRFVCYSRQQRILWVCTFAQARSLDNVINIRSGMEYSYSYLYSYLLEYFFSVLSCTLYLAKFMSTCTRTCLSTVTKDTVLMSTLWVLLSTFYLNFNQTGKKVNCFSGPPSSVSNTPHRSFSDLKKWPHLFFGK